VTGTLNILEGCRHKRGRASGVRLDQLGLRRQHANALFRSRDRRSSGVLYAATKRANELMAHNYSWLFKIPTTGLRFFTVYGPWGRPDMALFLFTRNILEGKPIDVFNNGHHKRDFTFVDDIAQAWCVLQSALRSPTRNGTVMRRIPHPAAHHSVVQTSATTSPCN